MCDLSRMRTAVLCLFLSASLALLSPAASFAEVLRTDAIMGQSMESRGLGAAECPSIDARYAIVVDGDGVSYFERNAYDAANIASITKVMTAIIAEEHADDGIQIYVSENAASVGESSAGLIAGDTMDLQNALIGLMVPSGNDAAVAIAESVGKAILSKQGSDDANDEEAMTAFVAEMNAKAAELGCTNTVFENPHGLDFGEFEGDLHSCAADVSLIVRYAMQDAFFRSIVQMETADLTLTRAGRTEHLELHSTDELLGVYEGACGIKTGNTDLAGPCFAGACERDGRYLYSIVLHSSSEEQRFLDTRTLFDWVYDNQVDCKLANSSITTEMKDAEGEAVDVPVVAYVSLTAWLDKTVPATFADYDQTIQVFRLEGNISQEFEFYDINGSVHAGDVVGKAVFYQRNEQVAEVDMIACEDVAAPSFFDTIGIWFQRVGNLFTGDSDAAENVVVNETPLILEKG